MTSQPLLSSILTNTLSSLVICSRRHTERTVCETRQQNGRPLNFILYTEWASRVFCCSSHNGEWESEPPFSQQFCLLDKHLILIRRMMLQRDPRSSPQKEVHLSGTKVFIPFHAKTPTLWIFHNQHAKETAAQFYGPLLLTGGWLFWFGGCLVVTGGHYQRKGHHEHVLSLSNFFSSSGYIL